MFEVHALHGPPTTAQLDALARAYPDIRPKTFAAAGVVAVTVRNRRTGTTFEAVGFRGIRERNPGFKVWAVTFNGRVLKDAKRPGKPRRFNVGPADLIAPPALRDSGRVERLAVTEGESDLLALLQAGDPFVVTSTAGGADLRAFQANEEAIRRWNANQVMVWGDADTPGREGAQARAEAIKCIVPDADVCWLTVPGEPESGRDLRNLLSEGADKERLAILEAEATEVHLPHKTSISAYKSVIGPETYFCPQTAADFLGQEDEPMLWIWDDYIPEGTLIGFSAYMKVGKSTFLYPLLIAIARGECFLDRPTRQCSVLILAVEENPRDVRKRLRRFGMIPSDPIHIFAAPIDDSPEHLKAIRAFVLEKRIKLVVIDTISRFWSIQDENNNAEVIRALTPLLNLAHQDQVALILVHHSRKTGGEDGRAIRGASAFLASVDQSLELERRRGGGANQRILKVIGRYMEETPGELVIELDGNEYRALGTSREVSMEAHKALVLGVLSYAKQMQAHEIAKAANLAERTTRKVLDSLLESREAERQGRGRKGDPYLYQLKRMEN